MCLLIQQPKGTTFSRAELQDFWKHNSDGFGMMWGDGKTLHVRKAMKLKQAAKLYTEHGAGRRVVLHFRMATHGSTTLDNTHPFLVTPQIGMAHNGILNISDPLKDDFSDTRHFAEYFIRPIAESNPDILFSVKFLNVLEDMIGASNRLVFAHADGRVAIVNKSMGVTHKKAWMSNTYAWTNDHDTETGRDFDDTENNTNKPDPATKTPATCAFGVERPVTAHQHSRMVHLRAETAAQTAGIEDSSEFDTAHAIYDVAAAYSHGQDEEVMRWIKANGDDAADILCEWYNMTEAQAQIRILNDPIACAMLIVDVLHGESLTEPYAKVGAA